MNKKNKPPKIKEGLRELKKNFIKDFEIEPAIKYEISKSLNEKVKNEKK